MENEFLVVMSKRTDEELIKILTVERENYNTLAVKAAELEVSKRNICISNIEQVREKAILEKQQKEKIKANLVGSEVRFLNFIIDVIVWFLFAVIVSFIVEFLIPELPLFMAYVFVFGTFIAYYALMEIKFQKTVGKFVTKTKVVKMNGEKPTNGDIITRTFCRFIPFDRISFLFSKNGIHDTLSKTIVVKDNVK